MNRLQAEIKKPPSNHLFEDKNRSSSQAMSVSTNYDNLTKSEMDRLLKARDKTIEELQEAMRAQNKADKQKLAMYREKLEEEIAHNQKAVKSFQCITQNVVKIIEKYQYLDQNSRETVANVVEGIRETSAKLNKQSQYEDEGILPQNSSFSCIEEIVSETEKLLQYLSKLTDENVAFVIKLKAQLARSKSMNNSSPPRTKEASEEIKTLKQEVNQLVLENKNLNILLEQNEQQKKKLLASINTVLTEEMIQELYKETVIDLIERIKRVTYRVKQLQKDKEQIYKKMKAEKQADQKKFQQVLKQIKEIRANKQNFSYSH